MKLKLTYITIWLFWVFNCNGQLAVGNWSNTGPVPFPTNVSGQVNGMGRVSQIKFHPTNPAKIYAVSASGGLFTTNDTGRSWAPTPGTEVLPTTACSAVCIDYTNDSILYLSTGDQNYYSDWFGMYKSLDGGISWYPANTGIGIRMSIDIIMSPTDHNTLIAATDDGIWKTTNGGASWVEVLDTGAFRSMQKKPGSSNVLFAATGFNFFKSNDMGSNWSLITSGVSVPPGNEGMRIAVTPADTNVVYLATTGGNGKIMKSINGGNTFNTIYASDSQCIVCYDSSVTSGSQGYYNFNISVNPLNANELLLGSHCVWRSTDGGITWSWRTQWWHQIHTDMHDLEFYPYDINLRFNANDGGVWVSNDTLATFWTPRCDGLSATEMYHAAQSPIRRQLISAGTQDNGELFYDGIWKCNRGGDWGARCGIDYSINGTVFYDNGNRRNISPLSGDYTYNAPYTITNEFHIEFPILMHQTAFIATDSIWSTRNVDNSSPTWNFLYTLGEDIKSIASCKSDSNTLYALTNNNHLIRSDNVITASPTFLVLPTPSSTAVMACVATNKHNENIVYLSCGDSLYRSSNKGVTWTNITSNLLGLNIIKIISDDYSSVERLFVCSGPYVYYKDSTTTLWTLTHGLPTVANITDMMIYNDSTSASVLRLSTYGRGAWECNIQNNLPPSGTFTSSKQLLCAGDTIKYSKNLYGNVTSFLWQFPGGSPASSILDSPLVTYSSPGLYNASLIVYGLYGNDTINMANYINVSSGDTIVSEGFEAVVFPPNLWQYLSQSGINWQQTDSIGGFGLSTHCMSFNNFYNDGGGNHDRIILPRINLGTALTADLQFDVAYSYYPGYRDTLMVDISTNCERSWSPIYLKDTTYLATAPDTTNYFKPTATEWRTDTITLTPYIGQSIELAFDNIGHYGQVIYIDNVNLHVTLLPVSNKSINTKDQQIIIIPNPATNLIHIQAIGFKAEIINMSVMDIIDQTIKSIVLNNTMNIVNTELDISNLKCGIYLIKLTDNTGNTKVEKFIKE